MNGKRILKKLIGLFLIINVILFMFNYANTSTTYTLTKGRIDNIKAVLADKGIAISAQLPRDFSPKSSANLDFMDNTWKYTIEKSFFGNNLASVKHSVGTSESGHGKVEYSVLDNEILAFTGKSVLYTNKQIKASGEKPSLKEAKAFCQKLMKRIDNKMNVDDYKLQIEERENDWWLTYYLVFDGIPVLDSYMTFRVCKDGVANGEIHLASLEITSEEKKEIYPIDLVLFNLPDYIEGQENLEILDVVLVYKRNSNSNNMWGQNIVPTYKIQIKGLEEALFVNAYNNQILK